MRSLYLALVLIPVSISVNAAAVPRESVAGVEYQITATGFSPLRGRDRGRLFEIPFATDAMIGHYRNRAGQPRIRFVGSDIGPTVVADGKIWFGLNFYEGQGSDGMGGIGFFDPHTRRIGILRHPALIDCSAERIEVDANQIRVLTSWHGELAHDICNGLVTIDRKTLASTLQLPQGKVELIQQKDDVLNPDEQKAARQYEVNVGPLAFQFGRWRKKNGPGPGDKASTSLRANGLEKLMLQQADLEYRWFEAAMKHGSRVLVQDCEIVASHSGGHAVNCSPATTDTLGLSAPLRANLANYGCTPAGFAFINLTGRGKHTTGLDVEVFAPGRQGQIGVHRAEPQTDYVAATPGARTVSFHYPLRDTLTIEAVKTVRTECEAPFQKYSGSVVAALRARLKIEEVNSDYVPPNLAD